MQLVILIIGTIYWQQINMEELDRHKKVLNMMISMHSMLRDSYKKKALIIDLIIFISSAFLTACIFVDSKYVTRFNINNEGFQFYIGLISLLIFILSIVTLIINWKGLAENHDKASLQLSKLLSECRQLLNMKNDQDRVALLNSYHIKYAEIQESIVKIPEKKFNALKSKHLKKVELSKLLDCNPTKPLLLLRIMLLLNNKKENL